MIKRLLFALLATAGLSINAQTAGCVSSTGFIDDYNENDAPSDGSISMGYWGNTGGVYAFTRDTINGDLNITVDQAQGGWSPMGVSMTDVAKTKFVDVSSQGTVEVSLTNSGSAGVEVYFSFISNNTSGANAEIITATSTGTLYGGVVAAGATVNWTFDVSDGRKHKWVASANDCNGGTMVGNYCLTNTGFDKTKLSGIEWTINGEASAATGWTNPAISNHPIKLHYIKSGACTNSGGNNGGNNGGGNNSSSCTPTVYTNGYATFYKLLENGSSNVVKCSFDALNDVKGTKYGALHKTMLNETPAKYCGMCVEMTGSAGTATLQIVDECPTCVHSSEDIDLSPQAFAAVVGAESIGIENVSWKEVPCPWQTPIHVIVQGSNQWYAKVIIGNHVNRIAKVEVQQGGTWYEMTREVDNGWVSTGITINEASKNFRVTDIHGEQVTVNGIDFTANPTNSKTNGTSNFTPCMITSVEKKNPLDYVSVYPNPATSTVTFEGIKEVLTMDIVSVNGQVVASKNLGGQFDVASLDISTLAPGIYVARMTGKNNTGTTTFVKR